MLLFGFNMLLVGAIWICLASGGTAGLRFAAFPLALLRPTTACRAATARNALTAVRFMSVRKGAQSRRLPRLDKLKTTGHIEHMSKPNLRDEILSAGLEALHSRGFNATSVQDITEAAGVPKGSFYNHFSSKEELGAAVVEQYALKTGKRRAILVDRSLEPLKRIQHYFEALIARGRYPGAPGCLLGNFAAELSNQSPLIRERVSVAFEDWTQTLAEVIEEAQNAGDVKKDIAAKAIANFLIEAWEGALLRARAAQDRAPLDAFLVMVFARILV